MKYKKIYKKHKPTFYNFFWRSLQIFSKHGVGFFIFFISAKYLTPEVFGTLNFLMAIIALLMLFCDFGLSMAISKFVTEYNTKGSEKINSILFSASVTSLAISAVISALVLIAGKSVLKENYRYVTFLLPYLFLMPLTSIVDGVYRGLKQFKSLALITSLVGVFSLAISFVLISRFYLVGAIASQNILYLLLAVSLFAFQKTLKPRFDKAVLKEVAKYAFVLGISSVAYFLYTKIDILILKQFGYIVEIGYYGIINKLFMLIVFPFIILGQVIAPNTTAYITLKDFAEIKRKFKRYLILCITLGLAITIFLYFALPVLLKTFLPEYHTAEFVLILNIMLALLTFKLWGAIHTQGFIIPAGFGKITAIVTSIGGILNVIFDYVFINLLGFVGVFWVTLVIHSLNIVAITIYFYLKIKSPPDTLKPLAEQFQC